MYTRKTLGHEGSVQKTISTALNRDTGRGSLQLFSYSIPLLQE